MLRFLCASAAARPAAAAMARRWASWSVSFQGGRRVFSDGKQMFGEQWHPDDDSRGYYFKLAPNGLPVGQSLLEEDVPFRPNQVGGWKLVKGGVEWKDGSKFWARHFDEEGDPFYVDADGRREWNPQPPAPKKHDPRAEVRWQQPKSMGAHAADAGAKTGANWRDKRAGGVPPRDDHDHAAAHEEPRTALTDDERQAMRNEKNIARWRKTMEGRKIAGYSINEPVPINATQSIPCGSLVRLIDDIVVILHRTINHGGITDEHKSAATLERLSRQYLNEFTINRWTLAKVQEGNGVIVQIVQGRQDTIDRMREEHNAALERRKKNKDKGGKPESIPGAPRSFWVPASVIALPGHHNAATQKCPVDGCNFDAHGSKAKLHQHLANVHRTKYKRCSKCSAAVHVTMIAEHEEACQAVEPAMIGKGEKKAMLTDGTEGTAAKDETKAEEGGKAGAKESKLRRKEKKKKAKAAKAEDGKEEKEAEGGEKPTDTEEKEATSKDEKKADEGVKTEEAKDDKKEVAAEEKKDDAKAEEKKEDAKVDEKKDDEKKDDAKVEEKKDEKDDAKAEEKSTKKEAAAEEKTEVKDEKKEAVEKKEEETKETAEKNEVEEKKEEKPSEEKENAKVDEKKDDASAEEKKDDAKAEEKKEDAKVDEKMDDAKVEEKKDTK